MSICKYSDKVSKISSFYSNLEFGIPHSRRSAKNIDGSLTFGAQGVRFRCAGPLEPPSFPGLREQVLLPSSLRKITSFGCHSPEEFVGPHTNDAKSRVWNPAFQELWAKLMCVSTFSAHIARCCLQNHAKSLTFKISDSRKTYSFDF